MLFSLVPVLKNKTLDPIIPKNYCPITISVIISKLIKYLILKKSTMGLNVVNRNADMFPLEQLEKVF